MMSQLLIFYTRVAGGPGKLLSYQLNHFCIRFCRTRDVSPYAQATEDQQGKYDSGHNRPDDFKFMVIGKEFAACTFLITVLECKPEHGNGNDHKSKYRDPHGDPE